jgi:hypothetical protein
MGEAPDAWMAEENGLFIIRFSVERRMDGWMDGWIQRCLASESLAAIRRPLLANVSGVIADGEKQEKPFSGLQCSE